MWSNCLLDLGTDFHVGNMVFARDAWYLMVEKKYKPCFRDPKRSMFNKPNYVSTDPISINKTRNVSSLPVPFII